LSKISSQNLLLYLSFRIHAQTELSKYIP